MKVILTIGSSYSGYQAIAEMLTEAGIAGAQAGSKASLSPQAMQSRLLHSHEIALNANAPLTQLQPGKLWNELATDLFLANLHQPNWGWADHQSAVLMDFWHDFDSQVRLLLVYNSPASYLEQALGQREPTPQAVNAALDDWARWNTALLRYLHRHPDYCVLVNSEQARAQPQALVDALTAHWQINGLDGAAASAPSAPAYRHLQAHLINQLIDPQHPALTLLQELDGAALLVTAPQADADPQAAATDTPSVNAAWAEWAQVRTILGQLGQRDVEAAAEAEVLAQLDQLVQEKSKLIAELADLTRASADLCTSCPDKTEAVVVKQESELLLLQLHQVQEELESYFLKNQELTPLAEQVDKLKADLANSQMQLDEKAKEIVNLQSKNELLNNEKAALSSTKHTESKTSAEVTELKQENELLLLQLHQVQEELEHYFLRNQELEKAQQAKATGFVTDFWRRHQPQELLLDMRQDITGNNWYPPEIDGCWAGPGTLSTLQLPPLQPGLYAIELDIVDAMNLAIVNELMVEALGQSLPVEVSYPLYKSDYPLICRVQLSVPFDAVQQPWSIGLRFPQTVSPAASGSDDQRQLAIRLRTVRLSKQS